MLGGVVDVPDVVTAGVMISTFFLCTVGSMIVDRCMGKGASESSASGDSGKSEKEKSNELSESSDKKVDVVTPSKSNITVGSPGTEVKSNTVILTPEQLEAEQKAASMTRKRRTFMAALGMSLCYMFLAEVWLSRLEDTVTQHEELYDLFGYAISKDHEVKLWYNVRSKTPNSALKKKKKKGKGGKRTHSHKESFELPTKGSGINPYPILGTTVKSDKSSKSKDLSTLKGKKAMAKHKDLVAHGVKSSPHPASLDRPVNGGKGGKPLAT